MKPEMYQRRPVTIVVEAVQITEENLYDIAKWCDGDVRSYKGKKFVQVDVLHPLSPEHSKARVGDWVLKSEQGYKIFNDQAFKKGWEPVTEMGKKLQEAMKQGDPAAGTSVAMNGG